MIRPMVSHPGRRRRAEVVSFPLARQAGLIRKIAGRMACEAAARAEKLLRDDLRRRIDALHRRGLSDAAVEHEVRAFEAAIRAEYWWMILTPPLLPNSKDPHGR